MTSVTFCILWRSVYVTLCICELTYLPRAPRARMMWVNEYHLHLRNTCLRRVVFLKNTTFRNMCMCFRQKSLCSGCTLPPAGRFPQQTKMFILDNNYNNYNYNSTRRRRTTTTTATTTTTTTTTTATKNTTHFVHKPHCPTERSPCAADYRHCVPLQQNTGPVHWNIASVHHNTALAAACVAAECSPCASDYSPFSEWTSGKQVRKQACEQGQ